MSVSAKPKATLLLLAYNQQDLIRQAVEAAFAQTSPGLEILLSDDASTDATYAIMKEMAASYRGPHSVRLRRTAMNAGFISHLRTAVAEADADIVVLAAGDDIPFPDRIERTLAAFDHDPTTMAVFSDISIIGRPAPAGAGTGAYVETTVIDMIIGAGGVGKGAAYAYRKACFAWPTELEDRFRSEDRILPLRATLLGRVFRYTAPLVHYRELPGSMSNMLARQVDQAHQSREHWRMTRDTLAIARRHRRISLFEFCLLDVVWRGAMWSRLLEMRAQQSQNRMLSIIARGLLLPSRLVQRGQFRRRFG